MGEVAVDDPFRPHRRSGRAIFGVDSGDAGHHPVGLAKIEPGIESQGHHRRRRLGGADAGAQREHAVLVHPEIAPALGKRDHAVEALSLDPVLELAGLVAGIGAALEHGDDDDLDLDR